MPGSRGLKWEMGLVDSRYVKLPQVSEDSTPILERYRSEAKATYGVAGEQYGVIAEGQNGRGGRLRCCSEADVLESR